MISATPLARSRSLGSFLRRLIAMLSAGAAVAVQADDYVVISAAAIPQYDRSVNKQAPSRETYVFTPGRHVTAVMYDRSDNTVKFDYIVRCLVPALAEQNYRPSNDPKEADLLIVVHWGTTQVYDDPVRESLYATLNSGDPGAVAQSILELTADATTHRRYMALNAELLGYKRSLREKQNRIFPSTEEKTMFLELGEERYFVVLMAYDYKVFKNEKRRHLVWATHINVRSAGNNFLAAVPQMSRVAGKYFGRNEAELVHVFTPLRDTQITIGEPEVLPQL